MTFAASLSHVVAITISMPLSVSDVSSFLFPFAEQEKLERKGLQESKLFPLLYIKSNVIILVAQGWEPQVYYTGLQYSLETCFSPVSPLCQESGKQEVSVVSFG